MSALSRLSWSGGGIGAVSTRGDSAVERRKTKSWHRLGSGPLLYGRCCCPLLPLREDKQENWFPFPTGQACPQARLSRFNLREDLWRDRRSPCSFQVLANICFTIPEYPTWAEVEIIFLFDSLEYFLEYMLRGGCVNRPWWVVDRRWIRSWAWHGRRSPTVGGQTPLHFRATFRFKFRRILRMVQVLVSHRRHTWTVNREKMEFKY